MVKRCHAQELTGVNCAGRRKHDKHLLQKFPQYSLWMKRSSRSLHLTVSRTKSVADCGNFWRRSLSSIYFRAAAWLPVNCACVPQLFDQLINTKLCPAFLRKFVCQPLCCVPLQIQTIYQSCPHHLIPCWLFTNIAVTSAVMYFWCHKLIVTVTWEILFAVSMEKDSLFHTPNISKFVDE